MRDWIKCRLAPYNSYITSLFIILTFPFFKGYRYIILLSGRTRKETIILVCSNTILIYFTLLYSISAQEEKGSQITEFCFFFNEKEEKEKRKNHIFGNKKKTHVHIPPNACFKDKFSHTQIDRITLRGKEKKERQFMISVNTHLYVFICAQNHYFTINGQVPL